MERPGANPTFETAIAVLDAAGARLEVVPAIDAGIDETLIVQNLRRSPAERLAAHRRAARRARAFRDAGARSHA